MNKPVAWMSELGTCYSVADIAEMPKNIADNFTIPLYTHPKGFNWADVNNEQLMNEVRSRGYIISDAKVSAHPVKELTDEEILEYSDVFALDNSPLYEFTGKGLVLFAKAILRKAQEK